MIYVYQDIHGMIFWIHAMMAKCMLHVVHNLRILHMFHVLHVLCILHMLHNTQKRKDVRLASHGIRLYHDPQWATTARARVTVLSWLVLLVVVLSLSFTTHATL